ncbi:MAG: FliM/FliN family flagellar motor C-terminal domain-containing protein [Planctomycetota bacterium]
MSAKVSTEEAAALAAAAGATGDDERRRVAVVAPRDFTEPKTLSAERIARICKTLSARLHSIANVLAGPLRGHPTLTLGEVGEVNAHGLFDGFARPFLVHGFQCAGQQGWVLWDPAAARVASDTILSGPKEDEPTALDDEVDEEEGDEADADEAPVEPAEPEIGDPMLTRTERRVVSALLDEILRAIADQFGLQVEKGLIWQEPEELTTLEDLGPDADTRRLFIHLGFDDDRGTASDIRIYLPGIAAAEEGEDEEERDAAPSHLAPVDMLVSAILGGTDVPLDELLAVEIGDVIPLDARLGDLVTLEVEETICARGRFGARGCLLSVLVEEIGAALPPAAPTSHT